jgi:glutathione S-transferase
MAAALRYQLAYCGVDFKEDLYEQGDAPEFSKQTWLSKKEKLGLDYPNLPYFIDGDFKMTETSAIHQYIADKWAPLLNG